MPGFNIQLKLRKFHFFSINRSFGRDLIVSFEETCDLKCFFKDESLIFYSNFFLYFGVSYYLSPVLKSFLANIDFSTEFLINKFLIKQNECIF